MNASNPKVSICIPAYEQPDLLERCLRSVTKQTFTDFEVIITDDSNELQLAEVVNKINDERILYYKNAVSLGSPKNWNQAVSYAKGEYIKILHHDDWFASDTALAQFVGEFEANPNAAFVFSQCYNITSKKSTIHSPTQTFLKNLRRSPETCLFVNGIGAPSVTMYKRSAQNPFFDVNTQWYVDVIFYARFLKNNRCFQYIHKPLVNVTAGAGFQVTNNTSGHIKTREGIYAFNQFGYFTRRHLPVLLVLHLAELFRRYRIKNFDEVKTMGFEQAITARLRMSYFLSKIPVNFKIYALIRRTVVCFLPNQIRLS